MLLVVVAPFFAHETLAVTSLVLGSSVPPEETISLFASLETVLRVKYLWKLSIEVLVVLACHMVPLRTTP